MEITLQPISNIRPAAANKIQSAIIRALLYFDIFDYPLTTTEIFENCHQLPITLFEVEKELNALEILGAISKTENFYSLKNRKKITYLRHEMNQLAESFFPAARKMSRLISYFPFVEGIFITGSLSKNCMSANSDVDYFIITKPGRLWLCRGVLTLFKKIFLLNSKKYFCINYYVDTESLAIPDKNIFTATEIIFAKATYNTAVCEQFFNSNKWVFDYYPNKPAPNLSWAEKLNKSATKKIFEKIFNGFIGNKVDALFFRMFVSRWKKKFGHLFPDVFEINFRSRKNISKHHPNGYQLKVLSEFEKRIFRFELENNIKLQP